MVQESRVPLADQRENPGQDRDRRCAVGLGVGIQECCRGIGIKHWLSEGETGTGGDLLVQGAHPARGIVGGEAECAAAEEGCRLTQLSTRVVDPGVEVLVDQPDQTGGNQVDVVVRTGEIAD